MRVYSESSSQSSRTPGGKRRPLCFTLRARNQEAPRARSLLYVCIYITYVHTRDEGKGETYVHSLSRGSFGRRNTSLYFAGTGGASFTGEAARDGESIDL